MGIRMNEDDDESEDENSLLTTFSEDVLKIEISGPDVCDHLPFVAARVIR